MPRFAAAMRVSRDGASEPTSVSRCMRVPTRRRAAFTLASLLFVAFSPTWAEVAPNADLKIAPRWGCAWVAPQITGSWIMFRYKHNWTKENAPTGKVFIELPAGVKCVSAIGLPFQETATPSGGSLVTVSPVELYGPDLKGGLFYLSTTLAPGMATTGKAWAEWDGGKSVPTEFDVKVTDARPVKQPKRLWTGAAMWPYMIANWPDYYKQYASLGFNHQNLWHGAIWSTDKVNADVVDIVTQARKAGISTSIDSSTAWGPEIWGKTPNQDALAMFTDGQRAGPCPSYRGPTFDDWQAKLARIAASGVSFILSDEETYGNGGFTGACVCSRCEARWREWLKANRPGMAYVSPKEVIAKNADMPEEYRAWLWFRASLTTERYKTLKQAMARATREFGVKSSPAPMLGWWAGAAEDYTLAVCMQDGRALSGLIDAVVPQLYFRYNMPPVVLREAIRRHAWATQGKAMWAGLDGDDDITSGRGGDFANTPGLLTAAVLETLMAGGKGYCMWAGAYMDTRQWAELSVVNGVIAKYEGTFLDGKETDLFRAFPPEGKGDYFHPYSKEVFVSTRETKSDALILITDYRAERTPFWVERSTAYAGPINLTDAFTGKALVKLAANQWDFRLHLKDLPVKLLVWKKGPAGR
ncbi:MAG: hypothetical protein HY318_09515 [Armatimonadetes bacterium]|nr:hypothetical protein [Armatimonadota bacterium]